MSTSITNDRAMRAAQYALDGLSLKQEVVGHNLSNVDTPGYQAKTVEFEGALRRALDSEQHLEMVSTHAAHQSALTRNEGVQLTNRQGGALRADGNNVDIDVELTQMAETGIQYQAISQMVSKKLLLLKAIASGS